jgi:WD40 repeat protein
MVITTTVRDSVVTFILLTGRFLLTLIYRPRRLNSRFDMQPHARPTFEWQAGLYTGNVFIWNYETGALVKTFEVTEVPVRSVAFIARKNWFVCGADDFHLRVYNYNTQERVAAFEAHPDYIRCAH